MQPHEFIETPFTLVLGGGGARGLAHIGVLKVLESEGMVPSLIVGSSMGAIIGGMYSQLQDSSEVQERIEDLLFSEDFANLRLGLMRENPTVQQQPMVMHLVDNVRRGVYFSRVALKSGAIENSVMIRILSRLFRDSDIRDTKIPFAAVAVNLLTGEEVILRKGSIIRAVVASSAPPGIVSPVDIDGQLLIDGSVLEVVPVQAAKDLSSSPVFAVDVSKSIDHHVPLKTGVDVILRAELIANRRLNVQALKQADLLLTPPVGQVDWSDFHAVRQLVAAGARSAERFLKFNVEIGMNRERNANHSVISNGVIVNSLRQVVAGSEFQTNGMAIA
jgi:NTE family protein